jgi:NADPH:quinone reductase-like Zn-dependent oxidoreductase
MSTQRAIVHESKDVAVLKTDVPLPKLTGDDWILVNTKAVALNPTDWKSIANNPQPGSVAGCDYAGVVEEVGKSVTGLKVGDRVAGFVRGGKCNRISIQARC